MKTPKELFESGAMLNRDYSGHEQMLMNEGTFIEMLKQYANQFLNAGETDRLKTASDNFSKLMDKTTSEDIEKKLNAGEVKLPTKADIINFALESITRYDELIQTSEGTKYFTSDNKWLTIDELFNEFFGSIPKLQGGDKEVAVKDLDYHKESKHPNNNITKDLEKGID